MKIPIDPADTFKGDPKGATETLVKIADGVGKVYAEESKGQTGVSAEALKNVGEAIRHAETPEERRAALDSNERIHRDSLGAGAHRMEQGNRIFAALGKAALLTSGAVAFIVVKRLVSR